MLRPRRVGRGLIGSIPSLFSLSHETASQGRVHVWRPEQMEELSPSGRELPAAGQVEPPMGCERAMLLRWPYQLHRPLRYLRRG